MKELSEALSSKGKAILATGAYLGEGFDNPQLDTLFMTMPISFKGRVIQYAGRLHRRHKGKIDVRIYDYVDQNIPVLRRMYERRSRTYKAMGYVTLNELNSGDEDMSSRNKSQVIVGIGYYKREEWERFLASAEDRDELEDTYDEWLVNFDKAARNAKTTGVTLKKVIINLDDLMDYCINKKRKNNSETRSHFIADLTRLGRTEEID